MDVLLHIGPAPSVTAQFSEILPLAVTSFTFFDSNVENLGANKLFFIHFSPRLIFYPYQFLCHKRSHFMPN